MNPTTGRQTPDATSEVDYLIVGAGASGMAFADTLLTETDATMMIVDERADPGGHWNDAYSFIRLHAPAFFYGAPSRELSRGKTDQTGLNAGFDGLATKIQILDYYQSLMSERLLPSDRVTWLPLHTYAPGHGADHEVRSLVSGTRRRVRARRRVVDARRSLIQTPSRHRRAFGVSPEVKVIAPGDLTELRSFPSCVCVLGAGKTAMDACTWLVSNGYPASSVKWIKPRESLVVKREITQDLESFLGALVRQLRAVSEAKGLDDFIIRLKSSGFDQVDEAVAPTQFRGAMLSQAELDALRSIKDVVRLGHVRRLGPGRILLDRGTAESPIDTVYVDCTAYGHNSLPPEPVFQGESLNLQLVRAGEPLFSAALIAHIEGLGLPDAEANLLCRPVILPSVVGDILRTMATTLENVSSWQAHPDLLAWVSSCRLDMLSAIARHGNGQPDPASLQDLGSALAGAVPKLPALIAEADASGR